MQDGVYRTLKSFQEVSDNNHGSLGKNICRSIFDYNIAFRQHGQCVNAFQIHGNNNIITCTTQTCMNNVDNNRSQTQDCECFKGFCDNQTLHRQCCDWQWNYEM